jgi:hypothetical protein
MVYSLGFPIPKSPERVPQRGSDDKLDQGQISYEAILNGESHTDEGQTGSEVVDKRSERDQRWQIQDRRLDEQLVRLASGERVQCWHGNVGWADE